MKKIFKGLMCAGLCAAMLVGASGCKNNSEHRDPETAPLRLSIGAVDRKFNPFFYTSQNDGDIVSMTQISMLGIDASGYLAYGENHPTVALDYQEIYKDSTGATIGTSSDGKNIEAGGKSDKDGSTTYEMLIKKGIKFSDGQHELTVMDVLFNLYLYLDPAYTGSSTIYSTKIKGLQAYRQQVIGAGENTSASNQKYYAAADTRIDNLIAWSEGGAIESQLNAQLTEDLEQVKTRYKEELESDWSAASTGWKEQYKEYRFTEAWEAFYFMEGVVKVQTVRNTDTNNLEPLKGADGKYVTTLDPKGDVAGAEVEAQELINEMKAAASDTKVNEYVASHSGYTAADARLYLQGEQAINQAYKGNTRGIRIAYVLQNCMTGYTVRDDFMLDAMSKDRKEGELTVPNISGITVDNTKNRNNQFKGKTYAPDASGKGYDILKIDIEGIDPKAKWNFAFAVAPMYYYSDQAHYDRAMASYNDGTVYTPASKEFGVEWRNAKWLQSVVGAENKTRVPVGAGAYKCTSYTYQWSANLSGNDFWYNNMAFFERNDQFTTLGSGVDNAKIKYVTYKQMGDDRIVEALRAKEIDYGEPNATADNARAVTYGTLEQKDYLTGGYGYIGINPAYVPDIQVRRAIMHVFDTRSIITYYGGSLVNLIDRPMSTTSWAYPTGATRYYEQITDTKTIVDMICDPTKDPHYKAGDPTTSNWYDDDGIIRNVNTGAQLELNFTIAGESTDHPAFRMLDDAGKFLRNCGIKVTVAPKITALNDLANGALQVWAAAWSSSIDPDPYQIYSIYSNASSTKNWNKSGILEESEGRFAKEYGIALQIADKIDEGRQRLMDDDRKPVYAECLDLIMELAVEFPTYQRRNLCVYNGAVLDAGSMNSNPSHFMGPIDELWKVAYKK